MSEGDQVGSEIHVYSGLGQADVSKGQPQRGASSAMLAGMTHRCAVLQMNLFHKV